MATSSSGKLSRGCREIQHRLTQLALDPNMENDFLLKEGVLCYLNRIWIGNDRDTQTSIIRNLHDSVVSEHSGCHATYNRVKRLFAWKGLKEMVNKFVKTCLIFQQAKTEMVSPSRLLQPLPTPKRTWAFISLNFIKDCPDQVATASSWWWWTNSWNMLTLCHWRNHILPLLWRRPSWRTSSGCMVSPWESSLIVIAYSPVLCGKNSSNFKKLSCG